MFCFFVGRFTIDDSGYEISRIRKSGRIMGLEDMFGDLIQNGLVMFLKESILMEIEMVRVPIFIQMVIKKLVCGEMMNLLIKDPEGQLLK